MPIEGARYRYKKGTDVRLAFKGGKVVEAKNTKTGATHTPAEFEADRKKKKKGTEPIQKFMNRRNRKEGKI